MSHRQVGNSVRGTGRTTRQLEELLNVLQPGQTAAFISPTHHFHDHVFKIVKQLCPAALWSRASNTILLDEKRKILLMSAAEREDRLYERTRGFSVVQVDHAAWPPTLRTLVYGV